MAYTNSHGGSRQGAMFISYVLWKEYGIKQADIGKMFSVSQGAIANWVKEVGYKRQIQSLEAELADARSVIANQGLVIPQQTQQYIPFFPSK